jgi:hypothetical protein
METLDDLSPAAELRRSPRRAADSPRRSEEHQRSPTRDRATPPERPLPWAAAVAPHPEGQDAPPKGSHHRTLSGPLLRHLNHRSDPKTTSAPHESPQRSEDHLSASRACVRAPGPHRRKYLPRLTVPKDDSTREALALRPCGPLPRRLVPPSHPEGLPDTPSHLRRSPQSGSTPNLVPASRLRRDTRLVQSPAPRSAGACSQRARAALGSEEPRKTRASALIHPFAPDPPTRPSPHDPEGPLSEPRRPAGRGEDALPNGGLLQGSEEPLQRAPNGRCALLWAYCRHRAARSDPKILTNGWGAASRPVVRFCSLWPLLGATPKSHSAKPSQQAPRTR